MGFELTWLLLSISQLSKLGICFGLVHQLLDERVSVVAVYAHLVADGVRLVVAGRSLGSGVLRLRRKLRAVDPRLLQLNGLVQSGQDPHPAGAAQTCGRL